MAPFRDPIERAADDDDDLQGVATWEPRSILDRAVTLVHAALRPLARVGLVVLATVLLTGTLLEGLSPVIADGTVRLLVGLSVVPALLLAVYVWTADVTTEEPLDLLVVTFVLAVLFAAFAAVLNTIGGSLVSPPPASGAIVSGLFSGALFFLVVGPVEEGVKLLAVRLHAYRDPRFDAVIDGAVYGAVAGFGFAAIENAIYISGALGNGFPRLATAAAVRALAGPGHVVYSAIAGYFLGLAKFNDEYAGPLVIKGLVVAAFFHGVYNTVVASVPFALAARFAWLPSDVAFVAFLFAFDGIAGYYLYRLIHDYKDVYRAVDAGGIDESEMDAELTEFDPSPDGTGTTGEASGTVGEGDPGIARRDAPDSVGVDD